MPRAPTNAAYALNLHDDPVVGVDQAVNRWEEREKKMAHHCVWLWQKDSD
jgi:hypothetical protein